MKGEIFEQFREWSLRGAGTPADVESIEECQAAFGPFRFTDELCAMYSVFNGFEFSLGIGILSLSDVLEKRAFLVELWQVEKRPFPPALFPVADMDGSMWFTVLSRERRRNSPILTLAIGDGDNELTVEYDSLALMAKTILEQSRVASVNQYPGTAGHYSDADAAASVQPALNTNMYRVGQKGRFSASGVQNVFDLDDLPQEWFG